MSEAVAPAQNTASTPDAPQMAPKTSVSKAQEGPPPPTK